MATRGYSRGRVRRSDVMRKSSGHGSIVIGYGAETMPKPDLRPTTMKATAQGDVLCPDCGASVPVKKATPEESGKNGVVPGIKRGALIVSKHRPGGGRVSYARGDAICKTTGLPVVDRE